MSATIRKLFCDGLLPRCKVVRYIESRDVCGSLLSESASIKFCIQRIVASLTALLSNPIELLLVYGGGKLRPVSLTQNHYEHLQNSNPKRREIYCDIHLVTGK